MLKSCFCFFVSYICLICVNLHTNFVDAIDSKSTYVTYVTYVFPSTTGTVNVLPWIIIIYRVMIYGNIRTLTDT